MRLHNPLTISNSEVTALEPASDGSQSQSPGEITTYEISISRPQSDTPNHGAKATPAGGDEDAVLEITQRSGNTTLKTLIPIKIRRDNLHFDNVSPPIVSFDLNLTLL